MLAEGAAGANGFWWDPGVLCVSLGVFEGRVTEREEAGAGRGGEEGQGRELESCGEVFIQGATSSNCHFKTAKRVLAGVGRPSLGLGPRAGIPLENLQGR